MFNSTFLSSMYEIYFCLLINPVCYILGADGIYHLSLQ